MISNLRTQRQLSAANIIDPSNIIPTYPTDCIECLRPPDVWVSPPNEDGEESIFGRPTSISIAEPRTAEFTANGRKLVSGNDAFSQLHVSSLWTQTLRSSFIYRLKKGSLVDDKNATSSITNITVEALPSVKDFNNPLQVNADLCISTNTIEHHTADYEIVRKRQEPQLVVRRGKPFQINLKFNRDFQRLNDSLSVVFQFGNHGCESQGTRVSLNCGLGRQESFGWIINDVDIQDTRITMEIQAPHSCIIGVWMIEVQTTFTRGDSSAALPLNIICPVGVVYILLNPWCPKDSVYLEDDKLRREYVLNDVGSIWKGGHRNPVAQDWVYGQFEESVLESCMLLLDLALPNSPALRSSAVHITRAIAQFVNFNDDGGVLIGRWGGPFKDGVCPSAWTGSPAILREYAARGQGVKYGQCWTFAGLVTTIARCLGIPSRVITMFNCAHDSDMSGAVDVHYSMVTNSPMEKYNHDSLWSYHCWNECWMKRPDLPLSYGGWQALDGTPQQRSQGLFRMGPASVKVTSAERRSLMNSLVNNQCRVLEQKTENQDDVIFQLHLSDKEIIGQDLPIKLVINNTSSTEKRDVYVWILVRSSTYTGRPCEVIHTAYTMYNLLPGKEVEHSWTIQPGQYLDKCSQDGAFSVSCMSQVSPTGQIFVASECFQLKSPQLMIEGVSELLVGSEYDVVLKIINPIPRVLTGAQFTVEGPGLSLPKKLNCQNIPPRSMASVQLRLKPWRMGEKVLVARFSCHQIIDVQESAVIRVFDQ